ncbi:hypothetical protein Sliba_05400 [Streptomyces nigrescens]|uniref:Kazal-like domain-containing protein n=1 Tax=Streptomyces nigrescens TaxID=1920 RepID=A0A640T8K6_STRNI|nr:hypothetical protein Sliba_05400 [Streptomyces libani subsp. libani]GGV85820.1 hypothetical protein GCM10010500_02930 [Streptomyces libani subsp. libani]
MTSIPYFRLAVAIFMAVCLSLGGASLAASAPKAKACPTAASVRCPPGYYSFAGKCIKKSNVKCPKGYANFLGKCVPSPPKKSCKCGSITVDGVKYCNGCLTGPR